MDTTTLRTRITYSSIQPFALIQLKPSSRKRSIAQFISQTISFCLFDADRGKYKVAVSSAPRLHARKLPVPFRSLVAWLIQLALRSIPKLTDCFLFGGNFNPEHVSSHSIRHARAQLRYYSVSDGGGCALACAQGENSGQYIYILYSNRVPHGLLADLWWQFAIARAPVLV